MLVAARDEASGIAATVSALMRALPGALVWVADDGSRDRTAVLASGAGARVVSSQRPLGKGGAMTLAARRALAALDPAGPEPLFLLCDGDLGDSAAALAALVALVRAGGGDVAVGAFRDRSGGGLGVALAFARWALRRRCGLHAQAPISGQRALSTSSLRAVLPFASGYGMELGIGIDAVRSGLRVVEVELDLTHRASGRTPAGFAHRARQLCDFVRVYATWRR